MSRQELRSTGGNCQGDDRQESCSSAGNCQADAGFVLVGGVGMILCGMVTDRIARTNPERKWVMAMFYSVVCAILLLIGFHMEVGTAQLVTIAAGTLLAGGTAGPSSAMVANLTRAAIHATAFATLTLANNLPCDNGSRPRHLGRQPRCRWPRCWFRCSACSRPACWP